MSLDLSFKAWTPGTKITEPGAYLNIPMSAYHGDICDGVSVSSSGLRTIFLDSLKHFWNTTYLNPHREEDPPTEAMTLGRAGHHLILGEPDFKKHFVIQPETYYDRKSGQDKPWSGNSLSCKAWAAEQALEGFTIVTSKQIEQIKGMVKSLAAEPIVQGGILNGHVECSLFWKDAKTGIWLKSRPDNIPTSGAEASDLKCVADISDDGIARGLAAQGYEMQGGLVREAFRQVWQLDLEHFTLVYVEQKRPHCVRFDEIAPDELDAGERQNHAALRLLRRALDTGYWPGPKSMQGDGGYVRRPSYATNRAAQRLAAIEAEFT